MYLGYDISQKAIDYAKENFGVINILADTSTEEIPEHDGLLTCPPYWNLEKYDAKNGLDRIKKWQLFLEQYEMIWKRVTEKSRFLASYFSRFQ